MLDLLFSGELDVPAIIAHLVSSFIIIFLTLPLHEWAHAFVATKLGDPTPGYQGRLTLNPFAHIDYFGALMIIFFNVGWAKPVQINTRYFNHIKRDMALTATAGPIMNLLIAFVFMNVAKVYELIVSPIMAKENALIFTTIYFVIIYYIQINISLAVFNLIPIPPFDGSRILFAFLPTRAYLKVMEYERYFRIIVLVLIFSFTRTGVLGIITAKIYDVLWALANIPFQLLG